jgi:hypothetical protein
VPMGCSASGLAPESTCNWKNCWRDYRIIFLDVDGVLVLINSTSPLAGSSSSSSSNYNSNHRRNRIPLNGISASLHRPALENLLELCRDTNSKLVISSSWRLDQECYQALVNAMRDFDPRWLGPATIIGRTPNASNKSYTFRQRNHETKRNSRSNKISVAVLPRANTHNLDSTSPPFVTREILSTPPAPARAWEIASWLQKYGPVKSWVAIDDLQLQKHFDLMQGAQFKNSSCVKTRPWVGLDMHGKQQARSILLAAQPVSTYTIFA